MFKHPFRNRLGIARASTPLTPPLSFDLQQLRRRQPNAFERIRGPLLDILGGVALGVTRDQADQRLLHHPTSVRDAVCVNAEETHAAVRPQLTCDTPVIVGLTPD